MSLHEAHRSFWLILLFCVPSLFAFFGCHGECSNRAFLSEPPAVPRPTRTVASPGQVNFKGVEKFSSCCLQGRLLDQSFKVSSETFGCFGCTTNPASASGCFRASGSSRTFSLRGMSWFLPRATPSCGLAFLVMLCCLVLLWLGCFVFVTRRYVWNASLHPLGSISILRHTYAKSLVIKIFP